MSMRTAAESSSAIHPSAPERVSPKSMQNGWPPESNNNTPATDISMAGVFLISDCLLEFDLACSVAYDYIVNLRSMSEFLGEFLDGRVHEVIVEIVLDEVDGAATEAATHHA